MPKYEAVTRWLKAHRPPDSPQSGLIHNDYRFDNVVLSPQDHLRIIGVLDWEMCTIGDPLMDLGSTLAYWVQDGGSKPMQGLRMQPSNLPGMPTREEDRRLLRRKDQATHRQPRFLLRVRPVPAGGDRTADLLPIQARPDPQSAVSGFRRVRQRAVGCRGKHHRKILRPDTLSKEGALNFQVQHSIGGNVAWENHTHTSVLKTGQ